MTLVDIRTMSNEEINQSWGIISTVLQGTQLEKPQPFNDGLPLTSEMLENLTFEDLPRLTHGQINANWGIVRSILESRKNLA